MMPVLGVSLRKDHLLQDPLTFKQNSSHGLFWFLSVQCYAWTEYKFTCVCPSHFLSTRLQVRPLNRFLHLMA